MWTITVDEARVKQLRQHDWGGSDPFLRRRGEGDPYRIRMVNGRCFFLGEDQRCRIHQKLGYDAKPEGCRAFPLHVTQVAGETHLRLSFYCPAVTAGRGKRLEEQSRWIKATTKSAGAVGRKVPLALGANLEITLRELEAIEAELARLLEQEGQPVGSRLAGGAALLRRLEESTGQSGKQALLPTLRAASTTPLEALAEEGRAGGSAARAGPVLSLFLGQDCAPGAMSRLGRFWGVRLFNLGLGRLRSHILGGAKASRGALSKVALDPPLSPASNRLLTRYLLHKLRSRRVVSDELTLVQGFNLLVAAYSVVHLLARLQAASDGRACQDEDVARAVQAADLLVVEHTTLYQGTLVATLTETVLSQDRLCASLLARLAR